MRIAFIGVKGMPYGGGIEKATEEIGSRLVDRGHEVIVYCDKTYCHKSGYYKGINLISLCSINHPYYQKISNSLLATMHALTNCNVDIVHLHSIASCLAPLTKIFGLKTISHVHSFEWKKNKWNRFVRFFLRFSDYLAERFADRIAVVSDNLLTYFKERSKGEVVLIRNGVNQHYYEPPDLIKHHRLSRDSYVLYIGRLSREKGLDCLVDTYGQINTGKVLVLAGELADGVNFRKNLLSKIKRNSRIIRTGYVSGRLKAELLSNAYFVVFPAEIEGSPIALLEAMSYGNCCLASDIEEHLEIMNGFGYTFSMGDSDSLGNSLRLLLSQKGRVERHKVSAKRHALLNFRWGETVDTYEKMCTSLTKNKG
jgi:glycosyltransferase involved in cell wall biosynthesis